MDSVSGAKSHAVLIDGDNFPADLADALLASISRLGPVAIKRVYGSSSGIAGWRVAAAQHGIALHEVMPGKNAADMKLSIDAMDILHRGKIKAFCLVSSDSDFAELARRLREDDVAVHGFGESKASAGFRKACNSFVALEKQGQSPEPVVQLRDANAQPAPQPHRAAWAKLLAQVLVQLPAGTTQLKLQELNGLLQKLDKAFSAKKYGSKDFKTLVLESGLQLNKTKGGWVALVPKALRRAA